MSLKDKAKFGTGYLTEAEEKNIFVLADDRVRYDKNGPGGAVKVEGYRGIWPVFGKPSERLGGADVVIVHDEDDGGAQQGDSENTLTASGSRINPNDQHKGTKDANSHKKGMHFAKRPTWMCTVKSACSPCEKFELHRPYCQPYGNRALIECRKIEVTKTPERKPLPSSKEAFKPGSRPINIADKVGKNGASNAHQGREIDTTYTTSIEQLVGRGDMFHNSSSLVARDEMFVSGHVYKGYQVCGKDRARETWDYAEFLGVNLILALIGIYVLLKRQRYLAGQHQSMLARRIGRT